MQDLKMDTFLMVCDYLNFTRAADALGLTQPAVSKLLEKLDHDEIDLAVVEGNFPKKKYEYLLFSTQNFVPICSLRQKIPGGSIENLLPCTLVLREPGSGNREILEHGLKRHNILLSDFSGIIETNDIKVQKALVQQGCGIAFLFEAAVAKEKELKIMRIEGFPLQHEINIVWRKNSVFQEEYWKLAQCFNSLYT